MGLNEIALVCILFIPPFCELGIENGCGMCECQGGVLPFRWRRFPNECLQEYLVARLHTSSWQAVQVKGAAVFAGERERKRHARERAGSLGGR